ncbi:MAG TPA: aminotransferase class V-fold PLP-dependent enzyme [Dehalococcoidia bacterium]|nr:aminotransferase class V-fold PLP-dependent enzyme [Dehalococcoidia bacterium]
MTATPTKAQTLYERLGVRPFINARGTITTLGGSIMAPEVMAAMAEAARQFVPLNELQEKAGERIAALTGAPAAFICAGAASGMLLAGAACLTGTDVEAIQALPNVGGRPNEFVISLVDGHTYIHQGFRVAGGELVKVGTRESVTPEDYRSGISDRTAAVVFFLGSQPKEELPAVVAIAHERCVPVIVDAAAQLPPRANLTDLTAMGADLVVFSGGKGLRGPQCSGLILGRQDLVKACALNSNPYSALGRGMKVGKEEIAGLFTAVEIFLRQDEEAVIREWERRCHTIAEAVRDIRGVRPQYQAPFTNRFPPASPIVEIHFGPEAARTAREVHQALGNGDPSILAAAADNSLRFGPQTLQEGEAEIIAARLRTILGGVSG